MRAVQARATAMNIAVNWDARINIPSLQDPIPYYPPDGHFDSVVTNPSDRDEIVNGVLEAFWDSSGTPSGFALYELYLNDTLISTGGGFTDSNLPEEFVPADFAISDPRPGDFSTVQAAQDAIDGVYTNVSRLNHIGVSRAESRLDIVTERRSINRSVTACGHYPGLCPVQDNVLLGIAYNEQMARAYGKYASDVDSVSSWASVSSDGTQRIGSYNAYVSEDCTNLGGPVICDDGIPYSKNTVNSGVSRTRYELRFRPTDNESGYAEPCVFLRAENAGTDPLSTDFTDVVGGIWIDTAGGYYLLTNTPAFGTSGFSAFDDIDPEDALADEPTDQHTPQMDWTATAFICYRLDFSWLDALYLDGNIGSLKWDHTGEQAEGNWPTDLPDDCLPVSHVSGMKMESATDLVVSAPGTDFVFSRHYTSDPIFLSSPGREGSAVGLGWNSEAFRYLDIDTSGPSEVLTLVAVPFDGFVVYSFDGVDRWTVGGPSQQYVTKTTVMHDGRLTPTWRFHDPGVGYSDFFRAKEVGDPAEAINPDTRLVGLLIRETDVYANNFREFHYGVTPNGEPRLVLVTINGGPYDETTVARVWFDWIGDAGEPEVLGMLRSIRVERPKSEDFGTSMSSSRPYEANEFAAFWQQTQLVEYLYGTDAAEASDGMPIVLSSDLGGPSALIQVTHGVRVDDAPDGGIPVYERVTQYRYHDGTEPDVGATERFDVRGADYQLKMVLQPEQIEYYAQKSNESIVDPTQSEAANSLSDAALSLLEVDDDAPILGATHVLADLASKIVGYEADMTAERVAVQYIQSDCGCSSAPAQGAKFEYQYSMPYDWDDVADGLSTWITESVFDDSLPPASPYRPYRRSIVDMKRLGSGGVPYTVYSVTEEIDVLPSVPAARYWATVNVYNTERELSQVYTPSAVASYQPAAGFPFVTAPPTATLKSEGGLAYEYTYTPDHRRASTAVRSAGASPTFDTVEETIYPVSSGTDERTYLPTESRRYRVAGSVLDDDIEVTRYEYGFYNLDPGHYPNTEGFPDDAVAHVSTFLERELQSENGPDGGPTEVRSEEMFDAWGSLVWAIAPTGSRTRMEYDGRTGVLRQTQRNSDSTISASDFSYSEVVWLDEVVGDDQWFSSSVDLLGRVVRTNRPYHVQISDTSNARPEYRIRRQVRWDPLRPGVRYLATVKLPQKISLSNVNTSPLFPDGIENFPEPASIEWENAAGNIIRRSSFTIEPSADYSNSADAVVAIDEENGELSRSSVVHTLSGLAQTERRWPTIATNNYYESTTEYDELGRIAIIQTADGTRTRTDSYDVLDRPLSRSVTSTDAPTDWRLIESWVYDDPTHSPDESSPIPEHGVGNGQVSWHVRYVDSADSNLDRETRQYYDHRDRLVLMARPVAPHLASKFDHLNRVVAEAQLESLPATSLDPSLAIDDASLRGQLSTMAYSQRGLMYRKQEAITPRSSSPAFVASNVWFDATGRQIAVVAPDQPIIFTEYDGQNRPFRQIWKDGTDVLGAAGQKPDVINAQSRVLAEVENTYDETTGLLLLSTTWVLDEAKQTPGEPSLGQLSLLTGSDKSFVVETSDGYIYDSADRLIHTVGFGTGIDASASVTFKTSNESQDLTPSFLTSDFNNNAKVFSDPRGLAGYEDALTVTTQYDERGLPSRMIDPSGRVVRTEYDDLSRVVTEIHHVDSVVDEDITIDRITDPQLPIASHATATDWAAVASSYVYDSADRVTRQVVHRNVAGNDLPQVTDFLYGVRDDISAELPSKLNHAGLLREIRYSDPAWTPAGGGSPTTLGDRHLFSYNQAGDVIVKQHRIESSPSVYEMIENVYTRDLVGRVTLDMVTDVPQGYSTDVESLAYIYDELSRLVIAQSLDNMGGILNEVEYEYDTGIGNLLALYENPTGPVDKLLPATGDTRKTEYQWSTGALSTDTNGLGQIGYSNRLASMVYPDHYDVSGVLTPRTSLTMVYADTASDNYEQADYAMGRLRGIDVSDGSGANALPLVAHRYIGLNRRVALTLRQSEDLPSGIPAIDPRFSLDRRASTGNQYSAGEYAGFDRHGRIIGDFWIDLESSTSVGFGATGVTPPPPIVALQRSYDHSGNVIAEADSRPGSLWTDRDVLYSYDNANRTTQRLAGVEGEPPTGGGTTPLPADYTRYTQQWDLDNVGNWAGWTSDFQSDGLGGLKDIDESRQHDNANRMLSRNVNGTPDIDPVFDKIGNLTNEDNFTNVYDGWNRLVRVYRTIDSVDYDRGRYTYNALHQRVTRDSALDSVGQSDERRLCYHDADWRLLVERVFDYTDPDPNDGDPTEIPIHRHDAQYLYASPYELLPIARRIDRNNDGVYTELTGGQDICENQEEWYWLLSDFRGSIRAILDFNGKLVERADYDLYGDQIVTFAGDVDGNSVLKNNDRLAFPALGDPAVFYDPAAFGEDGVIQPEDGYNADIDLDRDGDNDYDDRLALENSRGWCYSGLSSGTVGGTIGGAGVSGGSGGYPVGGGASGSSSPMFDWHSTVDIFENNESDTDAMFAGMHLDQDVGLYHARNRYYSVRLGRFISRDPSGFADGMNLYQYGRSNPATFVDPLGLMSEPDQHAANIDRIMGMFHSGKIDAREASRLVNLSHDAAIANIATAQRVSSNRSVKTVAGIKAAGNALADTVVSFATLGEVDTLELISVNKYERMAGYDIAYGVTRTTNEIAVVIGAGGARVLMVLDSANGYADISRALQRVIDCGKVDPLTLVQAFGGRKGGRAPARGSNTSQFTSSNRPSFPYGPTPTRKGHHKHHIIQDAAARDINGYSRSQAPATYLSHTNHSLATNVQRTVSGNGTYASERRIGYRALRRAGVGKDEGKRLVREADEYFSGLGVTLDTKMRYPDNRVKAQP